MQKTSYCCVCMRNLVLLGLLLGLLQLLKNDCDADPERTMTVMPN